MFIAMNRFKVKKDSTEAFETVWRDREVHIDQLPGFIAFHLLRGPEREDHILYSSHVIWANKTDFEAWTHSEAFRLAHRNAGKGPALTLGHPEFEGFDVLQSLDAPNKSKAA